MELKINHTWLASHLEADGAHDFTAGTFFEETEDLPEVPSIHNPMKEAFGTLVFLWRLDRNITPTKLAEMADVNLEEIELIERDGAYRPEPRTVVALAGVMKIPEVRLLQLSGHAETGRSLSLKSVIGFRSQCEALAANQPRAKEALEFIHEVSGQALTSRALVNCLWAAITQFPNNLIFDGARKFQIYCRHAQSMKVLSQAIDLRVPADVEEAVQSRS